MASSTLLAGELARRNKDTQSRSEAIKYNTSMQNDGGTDTQPENNNGNSSDWRRVLCQPPQQTPNSCVIESLDHKKSLSFVNYRNDSFSVALQDLIDVDSVNSGQAMANDSAGKHGTHFSSPSSLVTSLNSSREASLDRIASTNLFPKPPLASKFVSPATGTVSSWWESTQLRPAAISMANLPLFAAWTDT